MAEAQVHHNLLAMARLVPWPYHACLLVPSHQTCLSWCLSFLSALLLNTCASSCRATLQDVSSLKDFFETNLDLACPDALMGQVKRALLLQHLAGDACRRPTAHKRTCLSWAMPGPCVLAVT